MRSVQAQSWSFLLFLILPLPIITTPISNSTILSLPLGTIKCSIFHYAPVLKVPDCINAIGRLPNDEPGDVSYHGKALYPIFSHIAPEARHRLPIHRGQGSCRAFVNLRADTPWEQGSWANIKAMAGEVMSQCVGPDGLGGKGQTGVFGGIEVVLLGNRPSELRENQTLTATEKTIGDIT